MLKVLLNTTLLLKKICIILYSINVKMCSNICGKTTNFALCKAQKVLTQREAGPHIIYRCLIIKKFKDYENGLQI